MRAGFRGRLALFLTITLASAITAHPDSIPSSGFVRRTHSGGNHPRPQISNPKAVPTPIAHASSTRSLTSWTSQPLNPPSIPLSVRSPYNSAWLNQGGSGVALNDAWAKFWTGSALGWTGLIKCDGVTYSWLGAPSIGGIKKATQVAFSYTSTASTFVLTAGPIKLSATFLSPVETVDLTKQSFPFSYLQVSVSSTDHQSHSVQIYTDITGEWTSGSNDLKIDWSTSAAGAVLTHQVQLANPELFSEIDDHTQYGSAYYSMSSAPGVTYQTGSDVTVRNRFIQSSTLPNTGDTAFRAINDRWPVFAFAHDLGAVPATGSVSAALISVGHVRDPAIQYVVGRSEFEMRSSYFFSDYATVEDGILAFHAAHPTAVATAAALDRKVQTDAEAISSNYADIVALSVRQFAASTEFTVSKGTDGSFNKSDVLAFMKEISSDGNVDTIDVLFPSWPAVLYLAPVWGRYLLEPLYRYQASGLYPHKYSIHDLGGSYPNATGHNDGGDEPMPVEESGNTLIMTLAYTKATNDLSLIRTYHSLLEQWTEYLISDSEVPESQLSTDDFAGTLVNQTNLAIKGTCGINAMAEIEGLLGNSDRQASYKATVAKYVPQILEYATSSANHLELNYGAESSWGLAYNLAADRLLGITTFPNATFQMQTEWYATQGLEYGVPLDSRHSYTKSDWQLWTASTCTDTATRDLFVDGVHRYISAGTSALPFGDWYDAKSGASQSFRARPVVGGHMILLVTPRLEQ
ncbi:hypothetical protein RQP46_007057 [Phenoliferia psychrophenolica]